MAHVTLPHMSDLSEYDKVELDFTLGCPGPQTPVFHITSGLCTQELCYLQHDLPE